MLTEKWKKKEWVRRNFIDAKRLPLFGPFLISKGPMVSLAQREILVIVGSLVIYAAISNPSYKSVK